MGGDHAPKAVVEGVMQAAKMYPENEFQLYGDQASIQACLSMNLPNIQVIHCNEKITSEDEPVRAVRRKKDASMVVAAQAVKEGKADALFSAGNTGGLLACGLLIVGRIKGIDRPGLMPVLPVVKGKTRQFILMDVGANAQCKVQHLQQFAILGSYYAHYVLKIDHPRVGLLNNGTEEGKGNDLVKAVYPLLQEEASLNFVGNVEARELLNGVADVVVTDGFTGNAVLKTIEGTALSMLGLMKQKILSQGLIGKLGALLLKKTFKSLKETLDYSQFGGAVLFGLKAPVVKAHGSSQAKSVYYALVQIHDIVTSQVVADLTKHFEASLEESLDKKQ